MLAALDRSGITALTAQFLDAAAADVLLVHLDDPNPIAAATYNRITGDPFLLTALLLRCRSGNAELPSSPGAILQWVVETLWTNYNSTNSDAPDYAEVEAALSGFAYALTDADSPITVSQQEALTYFDDPALLDAALGAYLLTARADQIGWRAPAGAAVFRSVGAQRVGDQAAAVQTTV